jgi:hypothetical protein
VIPPKEPGLWTKSGMKWLRQLELPTGSQQLRRDLLLEEIDTLCHQVRRIEHQLNRQARQTSAVMLLHSIPGVGARTAEAVAAFIDDPQRFPNAKAVGRYFGLVPSQDQSGDRNRLGHITREGASVVRQLVAEAAWQAQRRSPTVRAFFERAQRDDPQRKKIALVATAPLPRTRDVGHAAAWNDVGRDGWTSRVESESATEEDPWKGRRIERFHVKIEGGASGCIPRSDMAQCDAVGVNGSNRIISHGAPHRG